MPITFEEVKKNYEDKYQLDSIPTSFIKILDESIVNSFNGVTAVFSIDFDLIQSEVLKVNPNYKDMDDKNIILSKFGDLIINSYHTAGWKTQIKNLLLPENLERFVLFDFTQGAPAKRTVTVPEAGPGRFTVHVG